MAFRQVCFTLALSLSDKLRDGLVVLARSLYITGCASCRSYARDEKLEKLVMRIRFKPAF